MQPTMNVRLDARIVPSPASAEGARLDYSHVVVIDHFFDEPQRAELLAQLTHPGWDHSQVITPPPPPPRPRS